MPFIRPASKTLVPAGTRTDFPSIVRSTIPGGVLEVVMLGSNSNALRFAGPRCWREANPARTLTFQNVRINFGAKMLQHGLNWSSRNLAKAADGRLAHRLRKIIEERQVRSILWLGNAALRPANEHLRHFLRAYAARDALATRFVAIKTYCVQRHVQHAGRVVANHNGAGAEHRPCVRERPEVETHIGHRGRQIA